MAISPQEAYTEWKRQQKDAYVVKRIEWALDNYITFHYGEVLNKENVIKYKFNKYPTDKQAQMIKENYENVGWQVKWSNYKDMIYLSPLPEIKEEDLRVDRFDLIDVD